MKTEIVIDNVGKTLAETVERIGVAEVILGLPSGALIQLIHYPKSFVQRRKIGGNEALLYMVHCSSGTMYHPQATAEDRALGKVIQIGMLIFTGENAYLREQQLLLSSKAYVTVDLATYAWSHKMKVLQEEVKQLEFPVAPNVTKQNYDLIEAKSSPAQACFEASERLTGMLNTYREQAMYFAPSEGLTEIVEEIEELRAEVVALNRSARRFLNQAYQVIKSL
jgi:hypothetical protein